MSEGGKRKSKKKAHYAPPAKRSKVDNPEPVNMTENLQGFLISCNTNEYQCLKETYNVLGEAAERLYGPYNRVKKEETEDEDIESSIAAEVAQLKRSGGRRFIQAKTKCNNMLFIRSNDERVVPDDVVTEVLAEIARLKKANCRYIARCLPVLSTFKATEFSKLEEQFRAIFSEHATKEDVSFSIMAKVRNNSSFPSESAIRVLMVDVIREERPNWTLNHKAPKVMAIVNITQRAGCVSLLEDYFERSKYNLLEYGKKVGQEQQEESNVVAVKVETKNGDAVTIKKEEEAD